MVYVPKQQGKIHTYFQVSLALRTPVVLLQDNKYYPVCLHELVEFMKSMPIIPYQPDINDCDNFAFRYKGIADGKTNAVGIVLGRYMNLLHVWNMALTNDGVRQFEPQYGHCFTWDIRYRPLVVLL